MRYWTFLVAVFMTITCSYGSAQDSILVTKNFLFQNGIFLSLEEFQKNAPSISWDSVDTKMVTNPKSWLTQVEYIRLKSSQQHLNLNNIWGLSIQGIPYMQIPSEWANKKLASFAGLRVRGKLCYFNFNKETIKKVMVSAINPRNGRPFRSAEVESKKEHTIEILMEFDSGKMWQFTKANFLELINDDKGLKQSVEELDEAETAQKLFKSLLIYDDRNPIYIK